MKYNFVLQVVGIKKPMKKCKQSKARYRDKHIGGNSAGIYGYYFSSAHSPRPRPLALGPGPCPNYLFTVPNDEITFSRPSSIKNYLFTAPSNNNSLPCLFLLL